MDVRAVVELVEILVKSREERMRRRSNRSRLGWLPLFEIAAPVLVAMHWCCVARGKCLDKAWCSRQGWKVKMSPIRNLELIEAVCSIQEVIQRDRKKGSSYQDKGGGGIWGLRDGDLALDPCTCHCSTEEGTPVLLVSGYIHQVIDRVHYVHTCWQL